MENGLQSNQCDSITQITQDEKKILQEKYQNIVIQWISGNDYCDICLEKNPYQQDKLVYCDLCNALAHQSCYGSELSEQLPEGDWFCQRCKHLINLYKQNNQFAEQDSIKCFFCPQLKGILKLINFNGINIWAHIGCVVWIQYLKFKNEKEREEIYVYQDRYFTEQTCEICNIKYGDVGECFYPGCKYSFHYSCARKLGIVRPIQKMLLIQSVKDNTITIPLFCMTHLEEKSNQKEFSKEYNVQFNEAKNFQAIQDSFSGGSCLYQCNRSHSSMIYQPESLKVEENNTNTATQSHQENNEQQTKNIENTTQKRKPGRPKKNKNIEQGTEYGPSITNLKNEFGPPIKQDGDSNDNTNEQTKYKLIPEFQNLMNFFDAVDEDTLKSIVSKYFVQQQCVNNKDKIVEINPQTNKLLANLFKAKNMEFVLPTKKFYKKFKKAFIVKYEIEKSYIDEIEHFIEGIFVEKCEDFSNNKV